MEMTTQLLPPFTGKLKISIDTTYGNSEDLPTPPMNIALLPGRIEQFQSANTFQLASAHYG